MQSTTRTAGMSLLSPFFWVLLVAGICHWSHAQGPDAPETRFGKIRLQDASADASVSDSTGTDFYENYIKGKTVLINFFYAQCDQGVCDQVMSKLEKVQQLLGDRIGRDRFIVSITLASTDDTSKVLKSYARGIKAKPGWSFLRGNVEEINGLATRLGLGKVSSEFVRSLRADSTAATEAPNTIEAKSPTEWAPRSLRALVGDRLVWKIGEDSSGTHGLRITNWDKVKQFVEVDPVDGFNATSGQNDRSTGMAGKVLVRLMIKSEPPVPTKITYDCTEHGPAMAGSVSLGQQHTGMLFAYSDRSKRHSFISFDATPSEIIKTLADLEGIVEPAPAVGSAAFSEITIDAGPGRVWKSGGNSSSPSTPTTPAKPLKVAAKKGQTLVFRQTETDPVREHGIVFTTPSLVELKTDKPGTKPKAVLKQTDDLGRYDTDVGGAATPQELARFEVIEDITTVPAFQCTVHTTDMTGIVEPAPDETQRIGALEIEAIVEKMSPNKQRRMLRFVNRAYSPADLTKSPQEIQIPNEHAPMPPSELAAKGPKGVSKLMAEKMFWLRPLEGWKDIRDCLRLYGSANASDAASMNQLLKSLGRSRFGEWKEVATVAVNGMEEPVMNAALLHTGKVLLIPNNFKTVLWDPNAPAASAIQIIPGDTTGLEANLFCSGHSFLNDGRLLAVGGGGGKWGELSSREGWKFDPNTIKWTRTGNTMAFKRWYPTVVTLGHEPGRVLIASGWQETGNDPATQMELYSESTDRFELVRATGPAGNLSLRPTYPGLHLLPGGDILHVPTGYENCEQSPSGAIADPTAVFTFSGSNTGSWRTFDANHRVKGMSLLLFNQSAPFVQAMVVGGGDLGTSATAQTMDLSTLSPRWGDRFPLLESRVHPNAVVLPDGTVFISGGMQTGTNPPPNGGRCELYDPKTGLVTEMDEMNRPRHYHSMALLLPTGQVMTAGGAQDRGCSVSVHNTIEVFSPPYLFRGNQPMISRATKEVEHGQTIVIETPEANRIGRIVLARPMAVTHQTDSGQRVIPLTFRVTGNSTIEAQAPGGLPPNSLAPPGYYMLFILDQDGVPSVAKWIHLGDARLSKGGVVEGASRNGSNEISLLDSNGKKRSLREFTDRAHVLVLIRGAFCKHCMTQLAELQQRIDPAKIPVIVITPENDLADLDDVPFTVLADTELAVFRKMNALGGEPLHGTFVFDSDGTLLLKEIGEEPFTDYDAIEKALARVTRLTAIVRPNR
jgi:cytochrome oxidase Cu insertion factor (SCO1/SenC/PrrC family)/peroxiredoxin